MRVLLARVVQLALIIAVATSAVMTIQRRYGENNVIRVRWLDRPHEAQQFIDATANQASPIAAPSTFSPLPSISLMSAGGQPLFEMRQQPKNPDDPFAHYRYTVHTTDDERLLASNIWRTNLVLSPNERYLYLFKEDQQSNLKTLSIYDTHTTDFTVWQDVDWFACASQYSRWCTLLKRENALSTLHLLETDTGSIDTVAQQPIQHQWKNETQLMYALPAEDIASTQIIYMLDLVSGETHTIAELAGYDSQQFGYAVDQDWFVAAAAGSFTSGRWYVINANPDDRRQFQLLSESFRIRNDYVWSPTEAKLLFAATPNPSYSAWNLYVMDLPSGETRQLSDFNRTLVNIAYAWSSDGSEIAFAIAEQRKGRTVSNLYVMPVNGEPRLVRTWAGQVQEIEWVADVTSVKP